METIRANNTKHMAPTNDVKHKSIRDGIVTSFMNNQHTHYKHCGLHVQCDRSKYEQHKQVEHTMEHHKSGTHHKCWSHGTFSKYLSYEMFRFQNNSDIVTRNNVNASACAKMFCRARAVKATSGTDQLTGTTRNPSCKCFSTWQNQVRQYFNEINQNQKKKKAISFHDFSVPFSSMTSWNENWVLSG